MPKTTTTYHEGETDESLILLYREGDERALNALISRYIVPSYRYISVYVRDDARRDDIIQIATIKLWRKLHLYDANFPFKPWYFTLLKNVVFDELRKKEALPFSTLTSSAEDEHESFEDNVPDEKEDIEKRLRELHDLDLIERYVDELPKDKKEIIMLHLYQELTFSEIADITGVSINTLKSTYRRAIMGLKEHLKEKVNFGAAPN